MPIGGFSAPNNLPASPQPSKTLRYLGCVGKTAVVDGAWAAGVTVVAGAALTTVTTVSFAVAGSAVGPEGTVAGAGLGFTVGASATVNATTVAATAGFGWGLLHGALECAVGD